MLMVADNSSTELKSPVQQQRLKSQSTVETQGMYKNREKKKSVLEAGGEKGQSCNMWDSAGQSLGKWLLFVTIVKVVLEHLPAQGCSDFVHKWELSLRPGCLFLLSSSEVSKALISLNHSVI